MDICVKDDVVVYNADSLEYNSGGKLKINNKMVMSDLTSDNSAIYSDVTLPDDFIPNCYTYDGEAFTATAELAIRQAQEEANTAEELLAQKQVLITSKIRELEIQQTPRRLRDAVLTADGKAWLEGIEEQIAELRKEIEV